MFLGKAKRISILDHVRITFPEGTRNPLLFSDLLHSEPGVHETAIFYRPRPVLVPFFLTGPVLILHELENSRPRP